MNNTEKEININEIAEKFKLGFDCSQVVAESFASDLCIKKEMMLKITSAMGGGLDKKQTCGAVLGAMVVIGLKYGMTKDNDDEKKNIMKEKRNIFLEKFLKEYKGLNCADVLGLDITKKDDLDIVLDKGLLFTICPKAVKTCIDILKEII